jgi:Zn-dependent protease
MYDTGSGWKDKGSSKWGRVFGDGDNPMGWSLPLYRLWGIGVRIHLIFIIVIIARLISTVREDQMGFQFMAVFLAGLFLLVLLHEYGHCFACRKVDGEADEILMWPLGGLASCMPPNTWKANLITVLGGPGVNVVLLPLLAGGVLLITGGQWDLVFFNPLADSFGLGVTDHGLLGYAIWSLHVSNVFLLAFNMLVPMYPMDCGRVVHALIWRKKGRDAADRITWTVGIASAVVLATLAFAVEEMMLFAIALFGGFVCFTERRKQRFLEAPDEDWSMSFQQAPKGGNKESQEVDHQEIDRILDKISEHGIQSLSRREKKKLSKASSTGDDS